MIERIEELNYAGYRTPPLTVWKLHGLLDRYLDEMSDLGVDGGDTPVVIAIDDSYVHIEEAVMPDDHRDDSSGQGYRAFTLFPSTRRLHDSDFWGSE
jgi:hypothetical protein